MRSLLLLLTIVGLAGCSKPGGRTLGLAVQGPEMTIAGIQKAKVDTRIVVHGTMTEKCPVAGCWFTLQDRTGSIQVDTKSAGFVVVAVPLKATLAVAGRVTTNGAARILDATGICY